MVKYVVGGTLCQEEAIIFTKEKMEDGKEDIYLHAMSSEKRNIHHFILS